MSRKSKFFDIIKQMMHGFGDDQNPSIESVTIVEDTTVNQLRQIVREALKHAFRRGKEEIEVIDLLFLYRNNPHGLRRLQRYFKSKCMKLTQLEEPTENLILSKSSNLPTKYYKNIRKAIRVFDTTGELLDLSIPDPVKHERELRANNISIELDDEDYQIYHEARTISFGKRKLAFKNWLVYPEDDISLSPEVWNLMEYLAYETVALIMDCVLKLREQAEEEAAQSDKTVVYKKTGAIYEPLRPTEILEAVAAYESTEKRPTIAHGYKRVCSRLFIS